MDDLFALLVGIDNYDQDPRWKMAGPCADAVAMAKWLLTLDPRPRIVLFLDPIVVGAAQAGPAVPNDSGLEAEIAALEAEENVTVHRSATAKAIEDFWLDELPEQNARKLLVFWSGHGAVKVRDASRERVMFCRDYRSPPGRGVFNASNFLNVLLGGPYGRFRQQLFLADVCGTYSQAELSIPEVNFQAGQPAGNVEQAAFYATAEGTYARSSDARGEFTKLLLKVLGQSNRWIDPLELSPLLDQALQGEGQRPYRVYHGENEIGVARSPLLQEIFQTLDGLGQASSVFRPYYLQTISGSGMPEPAQESGLRGMLQELFLFKFGAGAGSVPRAVLEFLVRLEGDSRLRAAAMRCLELCEQQCEQATLKQIMLEIEQERSSRILLVEVQSGPGGIAGFKPGLWRRDGKPVPGVTLKPPSEAIRNWNQFSAAIERTVNQAVAGFRGKLEIYFVTDAAAFGHEFHAIPFAGSALGAKYAVLVSYRQPHRSGFERQWWEENARALKSTKPDQVRLLPIDADPREIPEDSGFCYAKFALVPPAEQGTLPGRPHPGLQQIRLYLETGFPYAVWLHMEPDNGDWGKLKEYLERTLRSLASITKLPEKLTEQRAHRRRLALSASLLWDDPDLEPFALSSDYLGEP